MISATDPQRQAITGVPHAMASISTKTKRLGPIDREQQCAGISKESGLFAVADLPDEFDQRIGQQRLYLVAKIARILRMHLCGNLEAHAQALGDGDRPIGSFSGDAAEEGEIRIAGHLL
jgi:hypothetical protein